MKMTNIKFLLWNNSLMLTILDKLKSDDYFGVEAMLSVTFVTDFLVNWVFSINLP